MRPAQTVEAGPVLVTDAMPELLRQRRRTKSGKLRPFKVWAERVPEAKAGIMDWHRFPFQVELYDQHGALDPEMVIKKATQLGVSAWAFRWLLYHADLRARTGLYVFPKRQQMYDFSDARINSATQASDYLRRRIPAGYVNNKGLKRVGVGWAYFRGSEAKADLDAVDADVLVLDEYDMLRQENIPDAERRIMGSLEGMIRRVGVPSLPGYGIDKLYDRTDKRQWFVKCEMGHTQPVVYEDNMIEGEMAPDETYPDARLACKDPDCRRPLDVRGGEWVPEHPDRQTRGYHIPRLIVPDANHGLVVAAAQKTAPFEIKVHRNKDLGLSYAEEEGRLSQGVIDAATRDDLVAVADTWDADLLRTCGIDVGSTKALSVRISLHVSNERKIPLYIGEANDFGEVVRLLERYDPHLTCIDHAPDYRMASALRDRYRGRVWLARYAPNQRQILVPDPEMLEVSVRRVEAIDATFDAIRQQRNLLPANPPSGYHDHLKAMTRVKEEDEFGRVTVRYQKVGRADDYAHAEVYDMLAKEVWLWRSESGAMSEGETSRFQDIYDFEPSQLDQGTTEIEIALDEYGPGFED